MSVFVMVHGAWEGGWVFARVAAELERAGHQVLRPTLTGCGERHHLLTREVSLGTHAEDVAAVLEYERVEGAVLVGHSAGGTVITQAAARAPERIACLVYLDASAPVDGQNATGAFGNTSAIDLESDSWVTPPPPPEVFGVVRADDLAWVAGRRRPHPSRTLHEPVRIGADGARIPRAYVACRDHAGLMAAFGTDPLAPFLAHARAERWPVLELDAPHAAPVTDPEKVAGVLVQATRALA